MKKFCCILLAILVCFGMFGCEKSNSSASDEKEIINTDDYLYGEVIHKVAPNMLVLDLGTSSFSKKWGKTVYVITDDFDCWCIEDDVYVDFQLRRFLKINHNV